MRKWIIRGFLFGILVLVAVFVTDYWVKRNASINLFTEVSSIPNNRVGLLLGTIKVLPNGNVNRYYQYRIDAAVELFQQGKVEFILISGDNSREDYDEPTTMKEDLVKRGVPEARIFLDYAGFRTLDSVVRSKEVFGQRSITVISQKFHNERAIFLAHHYGINAIGFNAKSVSRAYGLKVMTREKLARCKMILDLIFGKKPKFLGESIEIDY